MKVNWCKLHMHKYVDLKQIRSVKFFNKNCTEEYPTGYRVCRKCHTVQEYSYDSQGGTWSTLSECRSDIILKMIDFSDFVITFPKAPPAPPPPG